MTSWLLFLSLLGSPHAKKPKEGEGVMVNVTVLDAEQSEAIAVAMVRHPQDSGPQRVNEITGKWSASEIFLPDGGLLPFLPGSSLRLEISAPGYVTQIVEYDIRKRRNNVEVFLEKMEIDNEDLEAPIPTFHRNQPREGSGGGAAN
jgi:hypothetical protein